MPVPVHCPSRAARWPQQPGDTPQFTPSANAFDRLADIMAETVQRGLAMADRLARVMTNGAAPTMNLRRPWNTPPARGPALDSRASFSKRSVTVSSPGRTARRLYAGHRHLAHVRN